MGSSSSCIERALSAVVHRMAPAAAAAAAARQNPDPSISVPDIVISLEKATPPSFFLRRIYIDVSEKNICMRVYIEF